MMNPPPSLAAEVSVTAAAPAEKAGVAAPGDTDGHWSLRACSITGTLLVLVTAAHFGFVAPGPWNSLAGLLWLGGALIFGVVAGSTSRRTACVVILALGLPLLGVLAAIVSPQSFWAAWWIWAILAPATFVTGVLLEPSSASPPGR